MVKVYVEFAIINVNSISDKNGPRNVFRNEHYFQ